MKGASSITRKSVANLKPAILTGLSLPWETWGRLRRELIWTLGAIRAKGIMTRFGFSCGQTEAFENLSSDTLLNDFGRIQMTESVGPSEPCVYTLTDCEEALEHLRFFGPKADMPQCWFLAGYLTGRESHLRGEPVYFIETHCLAKNDSSCRFIGKSRAAWMKDEMVDLRAFEEDNMRIELENTQEQLRLTKDRYQNLFEQSSSAIFIINPHTGVHLNANLAAAELTGYSQEELLGMTIFDLCHPEEHHRLMADMKSLTTGGRSGDREISLVRKDGLIRIIAHASKILSYGGEHVIQSVMRDVTDLKISTQKEKDLQNQLLRSERLSSIGRLAAGVAHELKNPLGAIRNAIYYVRNALKDNSILETDPRIKMILKLAEDEIDASVVIIGELLDFSRVVQLVPRRTLINDLLEKLPNIVLIPENVQLEWDLDLTLPAAIVDSDRLNQVFCNILTNACQAMPLGGNLKIKTGFVVETAGEEGVSEELIVISFKDTGSGIDPLHLSKIFEPLFTTKARGTGLGLAISRNIIEKHGGVILVTSQLGKGTSFTIKLPLQPPSDKEATS